MIGEAENLKGITAMNIGSIVSIANAINFGASKKIRQPEERNYYIPSDNNSGDVFTSSTDAKKKTEATERHVVVTYDDVYIFETPKKANKSIRNK